MHKQAMVVTLVLAPLGFQALAQTTAPIDSNLRACISAESRSTKYSSANINQAVVAILTEKCRAQWIAWMRACQEQGQDAKSCASQSGAIAKSTLNSSGGQ